jgi:hypothetical protein
VSTRGCQGPGTVPSELLVAYVDGEAPLAVVEHVRACPACAAEAASLAQVQDALRARLGQLACPPPQVLGEYALALHAPEARSAVARHVLECPGCAGELADLRVFLAEVPAPIAEGALAGVAGTIRRLVAAILPPSPAMAPLALRGAGEGAARTYRAADLTISLGPGARLPGGQASLIGLIVGGGEETTIAPGGTAQLLSPAVATRQAPIDELGNFVFDDVPPGRYQLELHFPNLVVVLEDVEVGR